MVSKKNNKANGFASRFPEIDGLRTLKCEQLFDVSGNVPQLSPPSSWTRKRSLRARTLTRQNPVLTEANPLPTSTPPSTSMFQRSRKPSCIQRTVSRADTQIYACMLELVINRLICNLTLELVRQRNTHNNRAKRQVMEAAGHCAFCVTHGAMAQHNDELATPTTPAKLCNVLADDEERRLTCCLVFCEQIRPGPHDTHNSWSTKHST